MRARVETAQIGGAARHTLVDAARELTPVLVELGPERATLESYLCRVREHEGRLRLRLSPVAAHSIPAGVAARIRPRDDPRWMVHASTLEPCGDDVAEAELLRVRLDTPPPGVSRGALPSRRGALVLVLPGGLDDVGAYVFPVRSVSSDACEVETSNPLPPGTTLPLVELIGDRRVLRRAAAQVLSVTPWITADGRAAFISELSLGAPAPEGEHSYDLVTETREVRKLLEFAGLTQAPGWYEAPGWGRGQLRFAEVGRDHAVVELAGTHGRQTPDITLRIGLELFTVQYEIEVRALSLDGPLLRTNIPLILRRRRRHRREHMVPLPEQEHVELMFVSPLDGSTQRRKVTDLSLFSLRFGASLTDTSFWAGLPLERAQLTWRERSILLGDIEVTSSPTDSGQQRCTAVMSNSRLADDEDLIALVASASHPEVTVQREGSFATLVGMYKSAGLFAPHMHRNLDPIGNSIADVWERLHARARDVVCTLTHAHDGAPDGAVSIVRAWETAWVAQHFVDVSPQITGATGKLQRAYLDHLLPRPDGRHLVFFIKRDNHVMVAYMRRFFASIGTREAASQTSVELWVHRPTQAPAGDSPGTGSAALRKRLEDAAATRAHARALDAGERLMVCRAAERCFGRDSAAALSMLPDELELPDTAARFRRAGLERDRRCRVIELDGEVSHALLEERSTPGINLTWMLNATWVIPVHALPGDTRGLSRALEDVLAQPAQAPTGEHFINLPAGLDPGCLQGAGFELVATVEMFVLNRAGVHQFFQYASRRYGELEARTRLRSERHDQR